MKRFIQVVQRNFDKAFENRCSCAVACGYVPCGNTLQVTPDISGYGNGDEDSFDLSIKTDEESSVIMVQCFYDPEGNATLICGHCAKCENCKIAPDEDTYCKQFVDACYKEE